MAIGRILSSKLLYSSSKKSFRYLHPTGSKRELYQNNKDHKKRKTKMTGVVQRKNSLNLCRDTKKRDMFFDQLNNQKIC